MVDDARELIHKCFQRRKRLRQILAHRLHPYCVKMAKRLSRIPTLCLTTCLSPMPLFVAPDLAQEGAAAGKEPVVPESLANVEEGEEAKVLKIIEQAMLVDSTEQCREFIEMIGVRSLVLAARLTEGEAAPLMEGKKR